jgi:hypothetical protein
MRVYPSPFFKLIPLQTQHTLNQLQVVFYPVVKLLPEPFLDFEGFFKPTLHDVAEMELPFHKPQEQNSGSDHVEEAFVGLQVLIGLRIRREEPQNIVGKNYPECTEESVQTDNPDGGKTFFFFLFMR